MIKAVSPCYKCSERHINCHAHCPRWQEHDSRMDELRAEIKSRRQTNDYFNEKKTRDPMKVKVFNYWRKK